MTKQEHLMFLANLQRAVQLSLQALKPPPTLTVSEWADQERVLSPEASAEPGRWDTGRAEYERGIMDAVSDPTIETTVVKCSAQIGKTEVVNNLVGFHIHQDPSPILIVHPTLEMGESWSKDRLSPMLRDTPALSAAVGEALQRRVDNTLLHKRFPGGHLTIAGANSPASLAQRPIRIVLCDDLDRFPPSAGNEGSPADLAWKRTRTFWNRKRVLLSTPTFEGTSQIEYYWQQSDKRLYFVPCPMCGYRQTLRFVQIKWEEHKPSTARYECEQCHQLWQDAHRLQAVAQGQWVATEAFTGSAGFHIWEAYSPWSSLESIVDNFLKSKDSPENLKVFINTTLGETWRDQGEAPDWQRLYDRAEDYPIGVRVPAGGLFLTAGVDVQKDRLEVQVLAWGRGQQSWVVDHVVVQHDPCHQQAWDELDKLLARQYTHVATEQHMSIKMMAVDSGYATQEVYGFGRQHLAGGRVIIIKGSSQAQAVAVGMPQWVDVSIKGKKIPRGVRVWPVGTGILKSQLYGWLRLERPTAENRAPCPDGYCHLPKLSEEYFRQLTAEQMVMVRDKRRGYMRREWQQVRARNEALDTWIYARAAGIAAGIERLTEVDWILLEGALGVKVSAPAPVTEVAAMVAATATTSVPQASPSQGAPSPSRPQQQQRSSWIGGVRSGWLRR